MEKMAMLPACIMRLLAPIVLQTARTCKEKQMFRINQSNIRPPCETNQPAAIPEENIPAPEEVLRQNSASMRAGIYQDRPIRQRLCGLVGSQSDKPNPLGEKSFKGIGSELSAYLGSSCKPVDEATVQHLIKQGEDLDAALTECANIKKPSDEQIDSINSLRAAWRKSFAALLKVANDQEGYVPTVIGNGETACMLVPAPVTSRMVFQGGGPKGQAYMGALPMLEACGTLSTVRQVAGASAGAIIASMVACGADFTAVAARALREKTSKIAFAAPAPDSAVPSHINALQLEMARDFLGSAGFGMIDYLNKTLRDAICDRLALIGERETASTSEAGENCGDGKRNTVLETWKPLLNGGPTFGQLRELAERYPADFKDLYVVAFDVATKTSVYFNSKEPKCTDLPISVAVRASAGLPVVFKSMKINFGGEQLTLVDGGATSNIPTEAFFPGKETEFISHRKNGRTELTQLHPEFDSANAQTLLLTLMKGGNEYAALHEPHHRVKKIYREPWPIEYLSGNPRLNADRIDDAHKSWALGPNVVVLGHGSLRTTSFNASPFQNLVAQIEGEHDMAWHLLLRTQQAIAVPVPEAA